MTGSFRCLHQDMNLKARHSSFLRDGGVALNKARSKEKVYEKGTDIFGTGDHEWVGVSI